MTDVDTKGLKSLVTLVKPPNDFVSNDRVMQSHSGFLYVKTIQESTTTTTLLV